MLREPPNSIFIILGSNLGNRIDILEKANEKIVTQVGTIHQKSSIFETSAWGKTDQPHFLNQVIRVESKFNALKTLNSCLNIEIEMGRIRVQKWGERIIDIDILYFNEDIINESHLIIPHPQIQNRRFTLVPLAEIAPCLIHPVLNKTQSSLLEECKDPLEVKKYKM